MLTEVLTREDSKEILEEGTRVTMACSECECDLTIRPSDVEIQMTVEEALVTLHNALSETNLQSDRTPDWDEIIDIQREQAKRAEEIDELARNL